jgi:MFS family permease
MRGTALRPPAATGRRADRRALDALNFLLADVQGGVGPFLAIFLTASQHWSAGAAGLVLTAGGLATVAASSPLGALVDRVRWKRAIVVAGALAVGIASLVLAAAPNFAPVMAAQVANGVADAAFPAAIAGLSLGLVGRAAYTARTGRNQAWNHGGNVVTALAAGAAGSFVAPAAVLWIVAALSAASIGAVLAIDPRHIDHEAARGADDGGRGRQPGGLRAVLENRNLLLFTAAITCFHFANAAMLTLAGEKLAREYGGASSAFMAGCITIAQFVMVPMAILVGRHADAWGRKPLFLACFTALPVRGVLFALLHGPVAVLSVQVLDGVAAGIFGALFPVVVADMTKGTGRYNLALGASSACWGLGAALSNGVAGLVVVRFGFAAAFGLLGVFALAALLLYATLVPETRQSEPRPAA